MKAIAATAYGSPDVLKIVDLPQPTIRANDILIRVRATTVTSGDWRVRSLTVPRGFRLLTRMMFGLSGPRQPVLGTELAGEVEAVGADVTRFSVGDAVFAYSDASMGGHAEYKAMPQNGAVVRMPSNLTFEESAALSFGGVTALRFLQWGELKSGDEVLVNGASGGVGTAAVQLARHFGARVTGVCSTRNVDLVRSIGAHSVIDYTKEDVTRAGRTYDVIVDTAGTLPYARSRSLLNDEGRLLLVLASLGEMLRAPWITLTSPHRVIVGAASGTADDLQILAELASAGELKPVIDRCYSFADIADAHRYVDQGRKRGNVVITVS